MNARDLFSLSWRDLARRHARDGAGTEAVLDDLLRVYAEPSRHYHTTEHIASLLLLLEEHGQGLANRDALALAILFHDAVYDPQRQDNEEQSAALAGRKLALLGFSPVLISEVTRYIRATKHLQVDAGSEGDLALLLDLDLSTLAAAPAEYRAYAQAIRREYQHVPDELYRRARRGLLEGFLARNSIYRTDRLYGLWEDRARANIAAEIAELA